jgi:hypothetical protein
MQIRAFIASVFLCGGAHPHTGRCFGADGADRHCLGAGYVRLRGRRAGALPARRCRMAARPDRGLSQEGHALVRPHERRGIRLQKKKPPASESLNTALHASICNGGVWLGNDTCPEAHICICENVLQEHEDQAHARRQHGSISHLDAVFEMRRTYVLARRNTESTCDLAHGDVPSSLGHDDRE